MRVRNLTQLGEFLDEDLEWRKRELDTLKRMVERARPHEKAFLLRAAVCVLYAHWEGFVRAAAESYASFVAAQGLRYRDLTPNFVALGLRTEVVNAGRSERLTDLTSVAEKMIHGLDERASIDWERSVQTGANLNSARFAQILCLIGRDGKEYESSNQLLDQKLLGKRNAVAHGRRDQVDEDDYAELHAEIIRLVDMFRDDVENAAALGNFRRQ